MFAHWLTSLGFTRDWAGWLWLRIVSGAGLVAELSNDQIHTFLVYVGIPLSDATVHRLFILAVGILWIAGKQAQSTLPSQAEIQSVKTPVQGV